GWPRSLGGRDLRPPSMRAQPHGAAASMILDYLKLYELLGESRYLEWALEGWRAIRERMSVTGGIGETLYFNRPPDQSNLHTETCQTSWWLIFNLHLARVTGDTRYLDLAERVLFNELLSQQLHRAEGAGFCALGDIDQGFRGGAFGLLNVLTNVYTSESSSVLDVNLFVDSVVTLQAPDAGSVEIDQKTDYPENGLVKLSFRTPPAGEFTLKLRVPSGASVAGAWVAGRAITADVQKSFLAVKTEMAPGRHDRAAFCPSHEHRGGHFRAGAARGNGEAPGSGTQGQETGRDLRPRGFCRLSNRPRQRRELGLERGLPGGARVRRIGL
ncbi:MAG: beta-L-arabinofuranosidase domain-containing protein, partial [Acidobacteriota bacterium]